MDKNEILLIRACKSKNPKTRLNSILKRNYLVLPNSDSQIIMILSDIIDKYFPLRVKDINDTMDKMIFKSMLRDVFEYRTIEESFMECLINKIRLADKEYLEELGFIKSAYWRNKK